MSGPRHPEWMHDSAQRLHEGGHSINHIAKVLNVKWATVKSWVDPDYAEHVRADARERKRRYKGTCIDCGTSTAYRSNGVARRCNACARKHVAENRLWPRERVIWAIQMWAYNHGKPPTSAQWRRSGPMHPAMGSVYGPGGAFPNWADAIGAAGYPRPYSPPGAGNPRVNVEEARKLRKRGWTNREIAEHFGVTTHAVYNHLGANPKKRPRLTREERIEALRIALQREENQ